MHFVSVNGSLLKWYVTKGKTMEIYISHKSKQKDMRSSVTQRIIKKTWAICPERLLEKWIL